MLFGDGHMEVYQFPLTLDQENLLKPDINYRWW